jgi:hypothetical protein
MGELLYQVLAVPLSIFPPLVVISNPVGQALKVWLGHVLGLARCRKLVLQMGNPSRRPVGLPTNQGQ